VSDSSPVTWLPALLGYVAACVAGVHLLKHSMRPLDGEVWRFGMSLRQCAEFAGGFATAGLGFLLWLVVLKRLPASVAFPIAVGASTIGVAVVDWCRGEPIGIPRLLGIVMILGGVALASHSAGK
jgi:multidrug transporter EmrE-like cation transporter